MGGYDSLLVHLPQLPDLVIAAALDSQLDGKGFDGGADIIEIPKFKLIGMEPVKNIFLLGFVLLQNESATAGTDLHQSLCLKQANGLADGAAANTQIRA